MSQTVCFVSFSQGMFYLNRYIFLNFKSFMAFFKSLELIVYYEVGPCKGNFYKI